MFHKKLLIIIKNKEYDEIIKDHFLIRHFLHNQESESLFAEIKGNIVPVIIEDKEYQQQNIDGNNKWKLIEYFDKWGKNHADEVVEILFEMYQKSRTPNFKRKIAISLENLGELKDIKTLFELAELITKEDDAMIREFGIRSISKFVDKFSLEQNKALIRTMFFTPLEKKDIVNQGLTMSLKFQAKDLADASFRSAAAFLGRVLENPEYTAEILPLFTEIYNKSLSKETYGENKDIKIKMHSTRWLKDEDLSRDRRKYESDPKKRLSLELWNALKELEEKQPDVFKNTCDYIIDNAEYIGYFEILQQVLKDKEYPEIVEKIIMNNDLIITLELDKKGRYNLFNAYFVSNPDKIDTFMEKVNSIKTKNNPKLEEHVKAEAYFVLPEPRPAQAQSYIQEYEKKIAKEHKLPSWKMSVSDEEDFQVRTYGDNETIDLSRFDQKRTTDELIKKLAEFETKQTMFHYERDIYKRYGTYFVENKDQLGEFYKTLKTTNPKLIKHWFMGYVAQAQIEKYKTQSLNKDVFYENMINLYDVFVEDSDAKLIIAKALDENEYLRTKETGEIRDKSPELFAKIKKLILDFSKDENPHFEGEEDVNSYIELNSVRGVAVRLLAVLAHYYSDEKDIYEAIKKMTEDSFIGIRAAVIENLVYLITKDYDFCERIIKKFEDSKEERINLALIHYMFRLGNEKLKAKESLLRKIAERKNLKEVQPRLGDLVGQAFLHKVELDEYVEDMIKAKVGDANMVESFALQLENEIPKILDHSERHDMIEKSLSCYNKLMKEYKADEHEDTMRIKDRLSFLFYDDNLSEKYFEIFEKNNVFNYFVEYGISNRQNHLNKYLLRCIKKDISLYEKILEILKKQTTKHQLMFTEDYLCTELIDILKEILNKKGRSQVLDEIFDEGLKYGGKGFYEIFDEWYKDKE